MKAKIRVSLKRSILDPQGKAVMHAVRDMNYKNIADVRIGKYIELEFDTENKNVVEKATDEICKKLLSNPLMENYEFELED